ncbi:hypothetical protein [Bacillus sp. 123MFChir2]|uniref:hypothetical protein n=1 Tax=Bacillus sp. 123MFChir2 TaxID=1169144 RepID=UPI00037A89E7|nr:hypothetical protein [Bacillus sp. 123MFChir2]
MSKSINEKHQPALIITRLLYKEGIITKEEFEKELELLEEQFSDWDNQKNNDIFFE